MFARVSSNRMQPLIHPRRPRGSQSGAGEIARRKFSRTGEGAWVPSLTGPFPNGFVNPGSRLGRKKPLYYSAQLASSNSRITFVCSYTAVVVPPYLSGSFTKVMRARETFSLTFLTGDETLLTCY